MNPVLDDYLWVPLHLDENYALLRMDRILNVNTMEVMETIMGFKSISL